MLILKAVCLKLVHECIEVFFFPLQEERQRCLKVVSVLTQNFTLYLQLFAFQDQPSTNLGYTTQSTLHSLRQNKSF